MHVQRETVSLTTDGSGAAVGYTGVVTGRVLAVRYAKTDFADGVDVDVTVESSGEVIWDQDNVNASVTVYPRAGVHDTAGVATTLDGTRAMREPIAVVQDRIKVAVASGGAAKTGTFHVLIG